MDPISFSIELELGSILIAAVGALATWLHNRNQQRLRQQRERHHQDTRATKERHHREHLAIMSRAEHTLEERVG